MRSYSPSEVVITGVGITSAIGQGKAAFTEALMNGRHAFSVMKRHGRQKDSRFLGAEIDDLFLSESLDKRLLKAASFTGQTALVTLMEAWEDAKLNNSDPERIGIIIGGSNIQQRDLLQNWVSYGERAAFVRPSYGLSFMDSDLCGLCTQQFGIRGFAHTIGGASASGQAAIIQAVQSLHSGQADICIAMGALMDLSYLELHALSSLGAMGSNRFGDEPERACRPFDQMRDGFIYGENCAVVVLERAESARKRQVQPYANVTGWAIGMDGNRNPNPSYEGEVRVIKQALKVAGLEAADIDYVNPHGSGSIVGDETELRAIRDCGLDNAYLNSTKSLTGHGLSAAGAVEIAAVLLQMNASSLHPSRNLDDPISSEFQWVQEEPVQHQVTNALNLSVGFGGINTAIVLQKV